MRSILSFIPGILRDGTKFQDGYCIDGHWIRFVKGKVHKMGGQVDLGLPVYREKGYLDNITFFKYLTKTDSNKIVFILAKNNQVYCFTINNYLRENELKGIGIFPKLGSDTGKDELALADNPARRWDATMLIIGGIKYIALLAIDNTNISSMYWIRLDGFLSENHYFETYENGQMPIPKNIKLSGFIFSNPCLYLYGDSGTIFRSKTADPRYFEKVVKGEYTISDKKLLYGASIPGGANKPCFLFWTENSLIYLSNIADGELVDNPVNFRIEEISTNCSLMSPASVVQYDSFFFWLGADRIYIYNGVVESVKNGVNLQYFLKNVDLKKRDKIYGYVLYRYNEIRWAYPERKYEDDENIGCTREIVYNVEEQCWYDTEIRRDLVAVTSDGYIYGYGDSITNYPYTVPNNKYVSIWEHEARECVNFVYENKKLVVKDIDAYFTTPWFGYSVFNKSGDNADNMISLDEIEPDFIIPDKDQRDDAPKNMLVTVISATNPTVKTVSSKDYTLDINKKTTKSVLYPKYAGRFITIKFYYKTGHFEQGNILLKFSPGGKK